MTQNNNSARKALLITCAVLVVVLIGSLLVLGWLIYLDNTVSANFKTEITVEAGSFSVDAADFLITPDDKPCTFVSAVTEDQLSVPGSYAVTVKWRNKTVNGTVKVIDTTPPVATPKDITARDEMPDPSDFVTDISDASKVSVEYLEEPDMSIAGTFPITIVLTDAYGNSSEIISSLTVEIDETAPKISGVKPMIVYVGDTVDYSAEITVEDDYDTDPTLTVDSSAVALDKAGTYKIIYKATDSNGNESTRETTIEVVEKTAKSVTIESINTEVEKVLKEIITDGMTEKEQVTAIYNWVRKNCTYNSRSKKTNYFESAYAMLTTHKGNSYAYYAVTKLLIDSIGFDNINVVKTKANNNDTDRYWSLVSLDGGSTWYHVDTTPGKNAEDAFCLVTDAFLDDYSSKNDNSHNRDKTLYPATPAT